MRGLQDRVESVPVEVTNAESLRGMPPLSHYITMPVPTRRDVLAKHDQLRGALVFSIRTIRRLRDGDEVKLEASLVKLSRAEGIGGIEDLA